MVNSKQKGSRVELELVHWLKERGCTSARRTAQFNGKSPDSLSDVVAFDELPSFHLESKGTKNKSIERSKLIAWTTQIKRDCPINKFPVVFIKSNNVDWIGMMLCPTYKLLIKPQAVQYPLVVGVTGKSIIPSEKLDEASLYFDVWSKAKFNLCATLGYRIEQDILIFANAAEMLAEMMEFDKPNLARTFLSECTASSPGLQSS